jgi:tetratricopeptide (TPR) repeat protein/transcriptional regulator with XRE-family HTH domain
VAGRRRLDVTSSTDGTREVGDRFGKLLRQCRLACGLTQEELAGRAGLAVRTIRQLEAGRVRPRPATVRLLGSALNMTETDLQRLHSTAAPPVPPPGDVPAQLPGDISAFAGRHDLLSNLDAILARTTSQPAAVVISAVSGTAGVGKTALAVHWAHRVRNEFPDGQLYVNLRGFGPTTGSPVAPTEAVRGFLEALGVSAERIPGSLDAQTGLYRSLVASRRVLLLLDNARDADQVRPLLPGSPTALVVVTSRDQLLSLTAAEGALPVTVDLLTDLESRELLAGRLGRDRVDAEPRAVEEIITLCARLPLALAIVAARAASNPRFPLVAIASELRNERLDHLRAGDPVTDMRAVLSWSYHTLSPEASRAFRLLGLHPGPDISTSAAASLTGQPVQGVRRLLFELTRGQLLTEQTPGRFAFHDLLRAYATELATTVDNNDDRRTATHRMLDHYLHTAHAAAALVDPYRDGATPLAPVRPGVTVEALCDRDRAMAWLDAEHPVLLAAIHQAADGRFDAHAWHLAWAMATFLDRRGYWQQWADAQASALVAAQRLADLSKQAHSHRALAHAYARLDRLDNAHTHLRHALDLLREVEDPAAEARTHHDLGWVYGLQNDYRHALSHARQALHLFQAANHQAGRAQALNNLGWWHAMLGAHQQAIGRCRRALELFQEIGDSFGEAATWDSLGYANQQLNLHDQAIACHQHALDLYRLLGDRYHETLGLCHLGDAHRALGNLDATRDAWRQALHILDELGHPDADRLRARLHDLEHRPAQAAGPRPDARSARPS